MVKAYTQNLYASEVYRELERQAVRKGHFDPTPEELVRSAAHQVTQQREVNRPVSVDPSDDLIQDVARLAYAMRRKGYITQAEDLEQKLVLYKQAESALYDVTSEKAQDYIDLAHADGDYQVEGFGELGVVETVESAAAKIRAVVQKEPTGKFPSKTAGLSAIAELIRRADLGDSGEGGGDYASDIKVDLSVEYKKINDHFATFPAVGRLARSAQLSEADVMGGGSAANLYIEAVKAAGVDPGSLSVQMISDLGTLNKKLADLEITGHRNTHAPFATFLENNRNNLDKLRELTTLLGSGAGWIYGFQKVYVSGTDHTGDAANYTWTGVQRGAPTLNGGSGLILNLTGTGGGGNPYINSTDSKITWDPAIKDQMARSLRQAYYNRSDAVFGRGFDALSKANAEIANQIQALDTIRNIRVETPEGAVDQNGTVNPSVAIQPIREARTKYDTTTKSNPIGYKAISIKSPDVGTQMSTWQEKFYSEVLTGVQSTVSTMSGQEVVDVSPAISKLQAAKRAWEGVREVLRPLRGGDVPARIRDVSTNLTTINRMISSLNGIGTPRVMSKPKALLDDWLKANKFTQFSEISEWADGAVRMAETERTKAQSLASGGEGEARA